MPIEEKRKKFFRKFPKFFLSLHRLQMTRDPTVSNFPALFHIFMQRERKSPSWILMWRERSRALGKLGACLQKSGGNPHLNISSLCTEVPNVPKYFFLVCFPNTRLLMPKQVPYDDPAHGHWSGHSAGASTDIIEILEADLAAGNLATD